MNGKEIFSCEKERKRGREKESERNDRNYIWHSV